ncbi:hypothetical protein SAMN05216474_0007 [Lishizhenia tianjinensis]|uniref:Uncharacterized protein n=1 Tax=Lishizhenia tianjinensis TaxID=477690 RepID=A0A1I6X912_9FLAO|nr:hypothetical protein [Lishizhenia tianjinensis]SFT34552.1 hypothetical protein SAMN05216474_0007 [Lishizhenia tianjinensis]
MKYLLLLALLIPFASCIKEPDCEIVNPEGVNYKGCGNFIVYDLFGEDILQNAIVHVEVDINSFALTQSYKSFDLANHPEILSQITSYNKSTFNGNLCTDGLDPDLTAVNIWTATSGTVNMRIDRPISECDNTYVVDVVVKDAKFVDDNGNEILVTEQNFLHRMVNYQIP